MVKEFPLPFLCFTTLMYYPAISELQLYIRISLPTAFQSNFLEVINFPLVFFCYRVKLFNYLYCYLLVKLLFFCGIGKIVSHHAMKEEGVKAPRIFHYGTRRR
jgi:hypothetical protein